MILAIWEGTSHRQMLDGLEVMERKHAHKLLFQHLGEIVREGKGYVAPPFRAASPLQQQLQAIEAEIERHLKLPSAEREALLEPVFRRLAVFVAETLEKWKQGVKDRWPPRVY